MKTRILDYLEHEQYKPLTAIELSSAMNIDEKDLEAFSSALRELEIEGLVVVSRKQRYGVPEKMGLLSGTISGNPKGYAFFIADDSSRKDIYINYDSLNGAMHRDRVLVRIVRNHKAVNGHDEGEVIRIVKRANEQIVGIFEKDGDIGYVSPDERRIFHDIVVRSEHWNGAEDGQKVVVRVTRWPSKRRLAEGRIIDVLGEPDDAKTDMAVILRKYGLQEEFPEKVLENAAKVAVITDADKENRLDLRGEVTFTIDGADARDLDDAVSIAKDDQGFYHLGVHIADVSHYVSKGSALDREAWLRATSVYLPDRVIPMLPKDLSNGICSLNPREDRLTMSCLMKVDKRGKVVDYEICESVICSNERLTYDAVNAVLDGDEAITSQYAHLKEKFFLLDELRGILKKKRDNRGSLNFDFPEAKVICDEKGEVIEIKVRHHGRAESIIEEAMILANETVASEYYYRDIPFIYRIHEAPADEDLLDLREFLATLGYTLKGDISHIRPLSFGRLLEKVADTPEKYLVEANVLRTMTHARYDTENTGHFGLASDCYTHFTSPIRRYPDLAIHRQIKEVIHLNYYNDKNEEKTIKRLTETANQSSIKEKNAEEAEREAVAIKEARYMAQRLGEEFDGKISGVASFGFFVELENTINGLVHVSTLADDFYEFHEVRRCLIGRRTGIKFTLGDQVRVKLVRVSIDEHLIDFELADDWQKW